MCMCKTPATVSKMHCFSVIRVIVILGFVGYSEVSAASASHFKRDLTPQDTCAEAILLAHNKNETDHADLATINATAHANAVLVHAIACAVVDNALISAQSSAALAHELADALVGNIVAAAAAGTADAVLAGAWVAWKAIHVPADLALQTAFQAACDAATIAHLVACGLCENAINAALAAFVVALG